ncbi:thrombospondin type 1 domain-containing protein [Babesia caballi]|uniref:Thrombospondin type 1 domain-containing protein n=1 Tax=Babesia caballi TaxID=5871 RepID=A0AAV4LTQ6_BABCB|nr:thrombospondin type 1 domain-containing protein [Babesia caballi]
MAARATENARSASFPSSNGSGIHLPDRSTLPPALTSEDYDFALANINHEYNALFTLLQRLRIEKLRKITSQDGWNPFDIQYTDVCIPILTEEVVNYGYDEQTSSCRCPNELIPCTRHQALNDREFWAFRLRKLITQSKFTRRYDRLKLATKYLNVINTKGILIQTGVFDATATKRRQLCNSVDAVLCSVRDHSRASTECAYVVLVNKNYCVSHHFSFKNAAGPHGEERFKIRYNNGTSEFVVDKRACELAKCSDYNQPKVPPCSISIVPPNEYRYAVVRTCMCPTEDSVMCSSEEARITMDSWLPQFREYCRESLIRNENNNILHKRAKVFDCGNEK